ncbi:MAG: hypothetical protein HYZ26_10490 [Chloroflexi bacterium]|nr:hypothetical protein [Chloroflexota bacterium]
MIRLSRAAIGGLLVLLGGLLLLQTLGLVSGTVGNAIWGIALGLSGILFTGLALRSRNQWWWFIPGLALLGLSAANFMELFLPEVALRFSGLVALGSAGLAFVLVYLFNRTNWWALIPGGLLITLGIVSAAEAFPPGGFSTDGIFFVGLGLTFLVLWLLPTPYGRLQWAIIPAFVLLAFGLWLGFNQDPRASGLIWPASILLVGLWLLLRGFRRRRS